METHASEGLLLGDAKPHALEEGVREVSGISFARRSTARMRGLVSIGCNSYTGATRFGLIGTTFAGMQTSRRYSAETFCQTVSKRSL